MTERLDACVARDYTTRDGQQKTAWTRIGAAFASKTGGYMVVLDIPPPASLDRDGKGVQYRFQLMVPRPRDGRGGSGGGGERAPRGAYDDADCAPPKDGDDIPF